MCTFWSRAAKLRTLAASLRWLPLVLFVVVAGKNVPILLFAIACCSLIGAHHHFAKKPFIKRRFIVWYTLCVLTYVSLLSPVDLCARRTHSFSVRVCRIIYVHDSLDSVRRAKAAGEKENVDFVVYHCNALFGPASWALVVCVPSTGES